eukprot:7430501-Alexandrium_andersonii.AAC.1
MLAQTEREEETTDGPWVLGLLCRLRLGQRGWGLGLLSSLGGLRLHRRGRRCGRCGLCGQL